MKKIFISSTFRDMDYERDILHNRIQPRLNSIALNYGESVEVCDLRWGVDTSELAEKECAEKVISVCFDEIDKCMPYMVVILGDRYGWALEDDIMPDGIQKRIGIKKLYKKSITELEILYGMLKNYDTDKILFYFRNFEGNIPKDYMPENEDDERKIRKLKNCILEKLPQNVKEYTVSWDDDKRILVGLEEFENQVINDLKAIMIKDFESINNLSSIEIEQRKHWNYALRKEAQFYGRNNVLSELTDIIEHNNLILINGDVGSGKSTIVSHLAYTLVNFNYIVLPIFCGVSENSNTGLGILNFITDYFFGVCQVKCVIFYNFSLAVISDRHFVYDNRLIKWQFLAITISLI